MAILPDLNTQGMGDPGITGLEWNHEDLLQLKVDMHGVGAQPFALTLPLRRALCLGMPG